MVWKGPARSNDVSNPTPATCLHQGRNEIALLFVVHNDVVYVTPLRLRSLNAIRTFPDLLKQIVGALAKIETVHEVVVEGV
jgi:hypothetical protein